MTDPLHDDPQLARALTQVANCRDLLALLERVLKLPRRHITADLSYPFRALAASNHQLAIAWNMLAGVADPVPEVRPEVPSVKPTESLVTDEGAMLMRRKG